LQMSLLQAAGDRCDTDSSDVNEVEKRAAAAEAAYRDSRDRLTDDMGWNQNGSK